jgi:hypothetical protein
MNNALMTCLILFMFFLGTASGICQIPDSITFHGTFVDIQDGHPIPEVLVRVAAEKIEHVYPDQEFAHATVTDTEGAFSLAISNESQIYYAFSLMALHPQYQSKLLREDMSPSESKYDLGIIPLRRTLPLKGKVTGEKNVAGLVVNLKMHDKSADFFRAAAPIEHAVKTDTTGNFDFTKLYPIEYTLTISRNGLIIAFIESINPQQQAYMSVHLPKLKTFRGTVVDTQERPIAGAQIHATRYTETSRGHETLLSSAHTDEAGNFQMEVLETESRLLSIEVSKKGYFSRVYENVDLGKMPPILPLKKGTSVKGRVILPQNIPSDGQYIVKVFPVDAQMEPSLNPLVLYRPILSRHFPVTESDFVVDGLFTEKYILYIFGEGISATRVDVDVSINPEQVRVVADQPTTTLQGQVFWADTGKPIHNAVVSRSWYPWELQPYDMSMTLDRFEVETDTHGKFKFYNLTEAHYQLHIRAVHAVPETATERYQRMLVHKEVEIPTSGTAYRIYIGRRDGTPFAKE